MKKWGVMLVGLILISFISANFGVGDLSESLDEFYGPSEDISGWINVSFTNQNAGELLEDEANNAIRLLELLLNQTEYDYDCSPASCDSAYSESGESTTKSFSLNTGQEKLIGFKIVGNFLGVSDVKFNIESDARDSCYNQVRVDFLNDGSYEKGNTKIGAGECGLLKDYGCFDSVESAGRLTIGQTPYCQRIELSESPGFKLGAWVKKVGIEKPITMFLKNLYGEDVEEGSCELEGISTEGGAISCEINLLIAESEDHYICIRSSEDTDYEIEGYDSVEGCGYYGEGLNDEAAAYNIFVEGKKFGSVGMINITNSLQNENTVAMIMEDYLTNNYDSDCSAGCIIPMKIKSGANQNIILSNLVLKYQTITGTPSTNKFYDLSESYPTINSDFGKLYLDLGGFSVPSDYGNYTFSLSLNEDEIISKKVVVEKVPIIYNLEPTLTASSLPTEFIVDANASSSIDNYQWIFGDGQKKTTTEGQVTYTYNATGVYELILKITDSLGRQTSKKFVINVEDPQSTINRLLEEKKANLESLKTQFNSFDLFYKTELTKILDLDNLETQLKNLEKQFAVSYSESQRNHILGELYPLRVPSSIRVSRTGGNLSFVPSKTEIDLDILNKIEQGEYKEGKADLYKTAVLEWYAEYVYLKLSFEEISAVYGSKIERVGIFYNLEINKKESTSYKQYLVLKSFENLAFKNNYLENEESGYKYIELKTDKKNLEFFTSEKIEFEELPIFVSPGVDRLSIVDITISDEEPEIKWAFMILVLVFVLIIGFVIYIILQEWYRKRYENYLFRDQTHLYNLVHYIDNSKQKGKSDGEIMSNLRQAKWNSEQITYALKKYAGERTGMFEIPINKILMKLRKKGVDVPKPSNSKSIGLPPRAVVPSALPRKRIFGRFKRPITPPRQNKMFFKK